VKKVFRVLRANFWPKFIAYFGALAQRERKLAILAQRNAQSMREEGVRDGRHESWGRGRLRVPQAGLIGCKSQNGHGHGTEDTG